jgi:hypothetical protein
MTDFFSLYQKSYHAFENQSSQGTADAASDSRGGGSSRTLTLIPTASVLDTPFTQGTAAVVAACVAVAAYDRQQAVRRRWHDRPERSRCQRRTDRQWTVDPDVDRRDRLSRSGPLLFPELPSAPERFLASLAELSPQQGRPFLTLTMTTATCPPDMVSPCLGGHRKDDASLTAG